MDRVLPLADYRQWTLSFPRWLRIRLLRDKALTSEVLAVFVRVVSAYHRRRARERGFPGGQTGAATAIQLGGSFVNANLHFHTLVPEGVWCEQPDGSVTFHRLPPPTDEDVEALVVRIVRLVARLLARRDANAAIDDELDALDHARAEAVHPSSSSPSTISDLALRFALDACHRTGLPATRDHAAGWCVPTPLTSASSPQVRRTLALA